MSWLTVSNRPQSCRCCAAEEAAQVSHINLSLSAESPDLLMVRHTVSENIADKTREACMELGDHHHSNAKHLETILVSK